MLYAVDQVANQDTVILRPCGIFRDAAVIAGRIGTVSLSARSVELMHAFVAVIRKDFVKVQSYWVGPGAHGLMRAGMRLTIGVNASRSLDLREK
jgi:hypothetical protein